MSALDTLYNIVENDNLNLLSLKCCLVDENKIPYTVNNVRCRPNTEEDFCDLYELINCSNINKYKGIGFSINFSGISAIDIDKCFFVPFNINSISQKAKDILEIFNDCYCEFSFSGTGIRILFTVDCKKGYKDSYYIKNSKENIEFYNPSFSYRYVTVTGIPIKNNKVKKIPYEQLEIFLNRYMKKPTSEKLMSFVKGEKSIDDLLVDVRKLYFKNDRFQEVRFKKAPGSGKNESEIDYELICYLYQYITKDIEQIKQIFMESPFYKSKDNKHVYKFTNNNYKYFYETCKSIIKEDNISSQQPNDNLVHSIDESPSLVLGIGGGIVYWLQGPDGDYVKNVRKLFSSFKNSVLISAKYCSYKVAKVIYETVGTNRLYIDSGGYTLYRLEKKLGKDNEHFKRKCESVKKKFLTFLKSYPPKECFELDNDYFKVDEDLLSPKNFLREDVKKIIGYYPTPVFKFVQGFEYWKRLCESPLYPRLAIGGLADTKSWGKGNRHILLKKLVDYAHLYNKKVHLLGCANVKVIKYVRPDSEDYCIDQYNINYNILKNKHPNLVFASYHQQIKWLAIYCLARVRCRNYLYDKLISKKNEEIIMTNINMLNIKKELKIVNIDDLKPYVDNPRHNDESAKIVAKSINEYGYINPIVIDENYTILAGHTRLKALKILGVKGNIEVLMIHGLTKEQIDGFVIADNRVAEYSTRNQSAINRLIDKNGSSDFLADIDILSTEAMEEEIKKLIEDK